MENTFSQEQKRHIYINARTFISDEQYYFAAFGVLFFAVTIWALTQNFQPIDTVIVFMCFALLLIAIPMYWFWQRRSVKNNMLNKHFKDKIYSDAPKVDPANKTWKDSQPFWFFRNAWFTLVHKHNKPWKEFEQMERDTPMSDDMWKALETMVENEKSWNNFFYRWFSYGGALAVLGTILRLHGVNKQSNTSGTILVLLYEIVFTLYCTWQLMFNEQEAATTVCLSKITDEHHRDYNQRLRQQNQAVPHQPFYLNSGLNMSNPFLDTENEFGY